MTSLCQQTSGCAGQADCPDKHCPGRRKAAFERANELYWSEESRDTPPLTQDELADFFWLGVGFFFIFVIGIPLLLWLIRSPAFRYAVAQLF